MIKDKKSKRRSSELTNQVFGHLRVLNRVENIKGRPVWACLYLCGNVVEVFDFDPQKHMERVRSLS